MVDSSRSGLPPLPGKDPGQNPAVLPEDDNLNQPDQEKQSPEKAGEPAPAECRGNNEPEKGQQALQLPTTPALPPQNQAPKGPGVQIPARTPDVYPEGFMKTVSGAVGSVWLYFGLQILFAVFCSSLFTMIGLVILRSGMTGMTASSILTALVLLVTTVGSGVLTFLFARKKLGLSKAPGAWKNTRFKGSDVFLGICACWTMSMVLSFVIYLLNAMTGWIFEQPDVALKGNAFMDILNLVTTVIAAPILEEAIFRGCILESLKKYSTSFAIVFSSLLFALLHMNLAQGLPVFGMGLIFGWMYVRTGSLPMTITLHMINNAVSMLTTLLPGPLDLIMEILLIGLGIVGLVFMIRERKNIKTIVFEKYQTALCWRGACHSIGFWIFVVVAALVIILPLFGSLIYGVNLLY